MITRLIWVGLFILGGIIAILAPWTFWPALGVMVVLIVAHLKERKS